MRDTAWMYTTIDPKKFAITAMYLPKKQFESIDRIHLIAPLRLRDTLMRIAEYLLPNWHVAFISDETVDSFAPHPNMLKYSLRAKLLYPLTQAGPYLFTDDDVIVTKDIDPILERGPFWSGMGFDRLNPRNSRDHRELEILNEVFGTSYTLADFNAGHTDSAVLHYDMSPSERSLYESLLHDYFKHPSVDEILDEPYVHRKRYRDQRFQTMWLNEMVTRDGRDMSEVAFWGQAPEKRSPKFGLPSKAFLHYCATSHKPWYMSYLVELVDSHREKMGWEPVNTIAAMQLAEGGK